MFNINKIIPPSDREHRDGFTNEPLIDKLTDSEKLQLEDELIKMLVGDKDKGVDTLIAETLAYLKSEKAVPALMRVVNHCSYEICRLSIYTSIFQINSDKNMIDLAILSFRKLENEKFSYSMYSLIDAFYHLAKFNRPETKKIIESYISHNDFLVSYNAKRSLGMIHD